MASAVMGIFRYEDEFLDAASKLKAAGFDGLTLMSPIPVHGIDSVFGERKSAVRRFSLAGAIIGAVSGFMLASLTAVVFILPTGGRPLITIPPYLVITYEMTILFGVLATLLGFHIVSGLPAWRDKPYDQITSIDGFSIVAEAGADNDVREAERIIKEAGAEEVRAVEPNP